GIIRTARRQVYMGLESCRRIFRHGLRPTEESEGLVRSSVSRWSELDEDRVAYWIRRIRKKYLPNELSAARPAYERYGWGSFSTFCDVGREYSRPFSLHQVPRIALYLPRPLQFAEIDPQRSG